MGQGVAQYFQVGLPSQDSAGKPGEGNDVRDDDIAGENEWWTRLEKLGPGDGNYYTKCTEQDRINVWSKHRSGVSEGSK